MPISVGKLQLRVTHVGANRLDSRTESLAESVLEKALTRAGLGRGPAAEQELELLFMPQALEESTAVAASPLAWAQEVSSRYDPTGLPAPHTPGELFEIRLQDLFLPSGPPAVAASSGSSGGLQVYWLDGSQGGPFWVLAGGDVRAAQAALQRGESTILVQATAPAPALGGSQAGVGGYRRLSSPASSRGELGLGAGTYTPDLVDRGWLERMLARGLDVGLLAEQEGSEHLDGFLSDIGFRWSEDTGKKGLRRGVGLPLEVSVRSRLEDLLGGVSLLGLRVHTGLVAEQLAHGLEAEAFTLGQHVWLGEGAAPQDTVEGLGVLVHEATHVKQEQEGRLRSTRTPSQMAQLEIEAHAAEDTFVAQESSWSAPSFSYRDPPASDLPLQTAAVGVADGPRSIPDQVPDSAPPVLRKPERRVSDSVYQVMTHHGLPTSREEFMEDMKDRLLELLRDDLERENERRGSFAWDADPSPWG